jgi:hypothetical protein
VFELIINLMTAEPLDLTIRETGDRDLRLEDDRCVEQGRKQPVKTNEDQPVGRSQLG